MTLRLGLILGALAALVLFVGLALHWREEAARERARADAAVSQAGLNAGTGAIADRVASDRVIILQQSEEKASAVEAIPSDDIPADVLSGWRSGLRYGAGKPDAERPGELPGTVQDAQP